VRAVAQRAGVSHGTVLFHFKRRDELITTLLGRVLHATARLRAPDEIDRPTQPPDRFVTLVRAEMDRLSKEPRHFRLFLEYWTLGMRNASIRRRIRRALEAYRAGFQAVAVTAATAATRPVAREALPPKDDAPTAHGLAAVAVSLVHGCALQSVIDPRGFDVEQHFAEAARMLDRVGVDNRVTSPYR
jgi:AcrR family transcriptional regulator